MNYQRDILLFLCRALSPTESPVHVVALECLMSAYETWPFRLLLAVKLDVNWMSTLNQNSRKSMNDFFYQRAYKIAEHSSSS